MASVLRRAQSTVRMNNHASFYWLQSRGSKAGLNNDGLRGGLGNNSQGLGNNGELGHDFSSASLRPKPPLNMVGA